MATCVSVYHLWSWKRVLSCLKQFSFLLRAKAVKRLCHCSANFPCKSDSEVNAWQPPPLTLLKSWTKGMCLQMSTCGFTWQLGMWVSGWICMYYQRQLHSSDNGIWCPQHEASCGTGSATLTQAHLRGAGSRETAAKMQDPGPLTGRTWQDSKQQNWKCRGRGGEEAEQTRGLILPRADFNRLHGGQDYSILNSGSAGNWEIEPYRGPWLAEGEVK